jgi:heme/copper-type cytochrome/quinol oxidase subunit 3
MTDYVAGDRPISRVPRTTEATGPLAVRSADAGLIASEATLFGSFVGTYYYLRFTSAAWPPDGLPAPKLTIPLILVGCLTLTAVPMQLASVAARAGRLAATRLFLVVALVVQSGYFAYEANDMGDQLKHRFDITRNAYSSIYYVLLGADHAHVFLGLLFDLWLLWKLARGLSTYRVNAVQAIAWYWHAVIVLTLVVTGTLLSARA